MEVSMSRSWIHKPAVQLVPLLLFISSHVHLFAYSFSRIFILRVFIFRVFIFSGIHSYIHFTKNHSLEGILGYLNPRFFPPNPPSFLQYPHPTPCLLYIYIHTFFLYYTIP